MKIFNNATELKESRLLAGQIVKTKGYYTHSDGGGAEYIVLADNTGEFDGGVELENGVYATPLSITSPRQIGWTESGGLVNYDLIAAYVNAGLATKKYQQIYSLQYFVTQWLNNQKFPLAFYGDSTTDGATTTGHVASFITGDEANFSSPITINNSPNAYPNKLDDNLNLLIGSANLAIYNAGFDSMSLANNFGNKAFHRVFYGFQSGLNNVDFSDVKGIALSWGTSDSINENDINTVLDSYEWKMELLIIECFERGVQPFINDPVLTFQRSGLLNGRRNDQSVSIIESINDRLRAKYGLEQLSLRKALESYVQNGFEQDNDFTEVLAVDGVHPNDKGHAHIAGTFTAQLHPLVKRLQGDEEYKFTAGNFYPITVVSDEAVDIWKPVPNDFIVTGTSFYYKWTGMTNNQFLYRIFVFCEKPMDLTYNMLSFGNSQNSESKFSKLEVINYTTVTSKKGILLSDNQGIKDIGQGVPWFGGGHQLLARLQVGLNQINVTAADVALSNPALGYLRAQPRNERNTILETVSGGVVTFDQTVQHKDIKRIASTASSVISWSEKDFNMENFHYSKLLETTRIMFTANTMHNRNICWNANRAFRYFDCYNMLKFSGTSVTLWRVDATNTNLEVPTETQIGSAVSPVDLSTVVNATNYMISVVQNAVSNTSVIVQYTDPTTGVVNNLAVIALTTSQPYHSGYSVGAFKSQADALPMLINNITVDFSA